MRRLPSKTLAILGVCIAVAVAVSAGATASTKAHAAGTQVCVLLPDTKSSVRWVQFDAPDFVEFLHAQSDLSPKWMPRFVRISHGLPSTATQKVLKRVLQRERWESDDDIWWRPEREVEYRRLVAGDIAELRDRFVARDREHLLGRSSPDH